MSSDEVLTLDKYFYFLPINKKEPGIQVLLIDFDKSLYCQLPFCN